MANFSFPIKKEVTNRTSNTKNIKKANLGMYLEDMINETNEYYLNADIAVIHKKPTPVQIVKVNYPSREHAVITEAYYKVPSTTDYNGIYKGYYIDFEAKESNSLTSFNLNNVSVHQVNHLINITKHQGIGFLIIYFKKHQEAYLLKLDTFLRFWNERDTVRKSIPYQVFLDEGYPIKISFKPRLDYLSVVDKVYLENKAIK